MSGPQPFLICADDFGLSPGVDGAIIELIDKRVVGATSVMPGLPRWRDDAKALRAACRSWPALVGWHVTLTDQPAAFAHGRLADRDGRLPPLSRLLPQALARALPRGALYDELAAQLDAFETIWGTPPAFVDGHQHVHLLPGVREALVALLSDRSLPHNGFWVRDTVEPLRRIRARGVAVGKAAFLARLGQRWRLLADQKGWQRNDGFAGAHDFAPTPFFRSKFQRFLVAPGPRHLVFVHPGVPDAELAQRERLVAPRQWEFDYLKSEECAEDVAAAGLVPATGWAEGKMVSCAASIIGNRS
jgi:predicted glycoside hydrolase/deacetylase ChbG (UPF0249 family)